MNTLLTQVATWFEYLGKKTANTEIIDWEEIAHMRKRLVQMRFAKPATDAEISSAAGTSLSDQHPLKGAFTGTNVRSKDRETIRRWNSTKSAFSDSASDKFDPSGVTVTKYGAPPAAVSKPSIEERVNASRSMMRNKLITTNQPMPAYDLDSFAMDTVREAELKAAMAQIESAAEH